MAEIRILVGTMTGTAELVAEEVCDELERLGHDVEVTAMDGLEAGVFERGTVYLICTSTYGQGDVPDNAIGLFEDLESGRPDLAGIGYGVIALGDRTYADTFCDGGRRFDSLLADLGGQRIGTVMEHDASDGSIPEEVALEWSRDWVREIDGRERAA